MDKVQQAYAHTAWTPFDPLKGLDPTVKRALLIMPSTFRERLKLAPWVDAGHRREAVTLILKERRVAYELAEGIDTSAPTQNLEPVKDVAPEKPIGAYYEARLHRLAIDRQAQDLEDWRTDPRAREDHDRRSALREHYAKMIMDLEERLADLGPHRQEPQGRVTLAAPTRKTKSKTRKKKREQALTR